MSGYVRGRAGGASKTHDKGVTPQEGEEPVDPGFGIEEKPTGENLPDAGIRHRGIPPPPPIDAPVPPQQLPLEVREKQQREQEQQRMREQEQQEKEQREKEQRDKGAY
jgi:hypothetical protein